MKTDISLRQNPIPPIIWVIAALPRIFLLALVLRNHNAPMMSDSKIYVNLAQNLLYHHRFVETITPVEVTETFRTPGYLLFMVPFVKLFPSAPVLAIALAQILLGFLSVLMAWKIFSQFSSKRGALLGTAFLAMDWVWIMHTPLILTETLTVFLLLINISSTLYAIRKKSAGATALCGFLWSATAFVKPLVLYLPIFLVWLWSRHKRCFAAFLIAAYLLPSFWMMRNWRITHFFQFSSVGGISMLRYPAAGVMALSTGRSWVEWDSTLRSQIEQQHPEVINDQSRLSHAYAAAAIPILKAHPVLFLRYNVLGAIRILGGTDPEMLFQYIEGGSALESTSSVNITGQGIRTLLKVYPAFYLVIIPYLAMLGLGYLFFFRGIRRMWSLGWHRAAYFLFCCPVYFLLLSAHQGYYRFRIPMLPFLAAGIAAYFMQTP